MVAAVLHLHIGAARPSKPSIRWAAVSLHRHDVVDGDLFVAADAEVGGGERVAVAARPRVHLVVVADDAVDFRHGGEGLRARSAPRSR